MTSQKIRIKLRSFDHKSLEHSTKDLMTTLKRVGADVSGPIPLPRNIERFTVNRSPHVNKKSREQFEIRTQTRLVIISNATPQIVEALNKLDVLAGVDVKIDLL